MNSLVLYEGGQLGEALAAILEIASMWLDTLVNELMIQHTLFSFELFLADFAAKLPFRFGFHISWVFLAGGVVFGAVLGQFIPTFAILHSRFR